MKEGNVAQSTTLAVDTITADLAVLTRARVVMQQLLLRCVTDTLDPEPLRAAYEMQLMLAYDLSGVQARLQVALPS